MQIVICILYPVVEMGNQGDGIPPFIVIYIFHSSTYFIRNNT